MVVRHAITLVAGCAVLAVGAGPGLTPATAASGGSTSVVSVHGWKKVYLHHDKSLGVTVGVKCAPGWFSSDLDVWLGQGTNFAESHTPTDVACDGAWHLVRVTLTSVNGPMHVGRATITSQFAVYNNDTGDPAGARDEARPAHIVRAYSAGR
jgi:hypothetical protein